MFRLRGGKDATPRGRCGSALRARELGWIRTGSIGVRSNERQRSLMRVWAAVLAVGTLVASARADAPTGGGRWVQARVPLVASGTGTRETRVWLPPSYDRPDARERRYPLVVLLHGWPGSQGNWPGQGRAGETLGRLCGDGTIPEVIALFPDGGGPGTLGRSLWADSWD